MSHLVATKSTAIQVGIACCQTAMHELQSASTSLKRSYATAGSNGWKDKQYVQLGNIVYECCSSLVAPLNDLNDCIETLKQLLAAVDEYERTNL